MTRLRCWVHGTHEDDACPVCLELAEYNEERCCTEVELRADLEETEEYKIMIKDKQYD